MPPSHSSFSITLQIIFVGVIGDGYKGDIALGAVTVEGGKNCTLTPARAIPGSACFPSCVSPTKCDSVTGKCFCPIEELVDHKCGNGKDNRHALFVCFVFLIVYSYRFKAIRKLGKLVVVK